MTDVGQTKLYFRSFLVLFVTWVSKWDQSLSPFSNTVFFSTVRSRCRRHPLHFEDIEEEPADKEKHLFSQVQTQSQFLKSYLWWFTGFEISDGEYLSEIGLVLLLDLTLFRFDPETTSMSHFLKKFHPKLTFDFVQGMIS